MTTLLHPFFRGIVSLRAVSRCTGISTADLSEMKTGRKVPTSMMVRKLADGLGVDQSVIRKTCAKLVRERLAELKNGM